eukprot:3492479-Rhodomonas_salina.2
MAYQACRQIHYATTTTTTTTTKSFLRKVPESEAHAPPPSSPPVVQTHTMISTVARCVVLISSDVRYPVLIYATHCQAQYQVPHAAQLRQAVAREAHYCVHVQCTGSTYSFSVPHLYPFSVLQCRTRVLPQSQTRTLSQYRTSRVHIAQRHTASQLMAPQSTASSRYESNAHHIPQTAQRHTLAEYRASHSARVGA